MLNFSNFQIARHDFSNVAVSGHFTRCHALYIVFRRSCDNAALESGTLRYQYAMRHINASISATIDEIVETKTAEHFEQHSKKITDRIDALETENMALRKNVSDLDNCNCLDTLIIHGIRESALIATASTLEQSDQDSDGSEDLCQTVLQLCNNRLELDLTCSDILSAYRIRQQKKTVCRPILVKFKTRSA